jgi:hypothetical protein
MGVFKDGVYYYNCRKCGALARVDDDCGEGPVATLCGYCEARCDADYKKWFAWNELPWHKRLFKLKPRDPRLDW